MRRNRKLRTILLILVLLLIILFLPIFHSISEKLSKTAMVDANILIVEGWLPNYAINAAYKEFNKKQYDRIITTGLKSTPEYFNVFTNGSLIFYFHKWLQADTITKKHVIEVNAFSSLGGDNRAHFYVWINDLKTGNFFAERGRGSYSIQWKGRLNYIDSISIQFVNDGIGKFGDINLFVKEIILDHELFIPYQFNSAYVFPEQNGIIRIINNYESYADQARNALLSLGIDSAFITSIPAKNVILNRTLASALAFRDWLKISNIEIKGINIITLGKHAGRTLMIYKKILNKQYDIGIISIPDSRENYSTRFKVLNTIREALGMFYYWLILLLY
jgi:hypothetical protein